ncbi:hypothetical protein [Heyndrickxia acidicola]|nr:hypothetical protein [Heyndrickxia acidicola]
MESAGHWGTLQELAMMRLPTHRGKRAPTADIKQQDDQNAAYIYVQANF